MEALKHVRPVAPVLHINADYRKIGTWTETALEAAALSHAIGITTARVRAAQIVARLGRENIHHPTRQKWFVRLDKITSRDRIRIEAPSTTC